MDLSFSQLLASPKIKLDTKIKSKLDQMDKILKNVHNYNTTKVDIEQLNREAKLEAKKEFCNEIDALKLNFGKLDDQVDYFGGFNKICSQINKGLNKESLFNNHPYTVFKKSDLYGGERFDEKQIEIILNEKDDNLKMFKTALKMISIESEIDKIMAIKKFSINKMISTSIVDVYATLIKILINWGINLEILDRYVIKYKNIKDNVSLKQILPKEDDDNNDLNLTQLFVNIVDLIEISMNTVKIYDPQILSDYISIILILWTDKQWRFNFECSNSLLHLLIIVLNRIDNSTSTIKNVSKTIQKYFKNKYAEFFEFLDFFPDTTENLVNIKFALCKISLRKYNIKIGHNEERIDLTFKNLNELKCSTEEIKLVIAFIDHFYKTRELTDVLSQQISDRFAKFVEDFEFDHENQSSIDFKQYLKSLIEQYDKNQKETPIKKKSKTGHAGRPRKIAKADLKEATKIWEALESELNE